MKRLIILGSTGSIGVQTLDVVRQFYKEIEIVGLAAGNNVKLIEQQIQEFNPKYIYSLSKQFTDRFEATFLSMEEMVQCEKVDLIVIATSGSVGFLPTVLALKHSQTVALANKEVIVMGGDLIMNLAKENKTKIIPVDSEPSAIWQCLLGDRDMKKIILTASGGPFRNISEENLKSITPEQALAHPTWNMGKKITIDSATLMNKAFEVIEAKFLFNLNWDNIEVILHPQSIIHSLVEFSDGSIKAHLGVPDMRIPIQYAIFHPRRLENPTISNLNLDMLGNLTFHSLQYDKFPCFSLGLSIGKLGGTFPTVLTSVDEVAVNAFLDQKIRFTEIKNMINTVIEKHNTISNPTVEDILHIDQWARDEANKEFQE